MTPQAAAPIPTDERIEVLDTIRGFALLARAAGLLGQLAEEARRPIGMDAYLTVDRNAVYVDPTDTQGEH